MKLFYLSLLILCSAVYAAAEPVRGQTEEAPENVAKDKPRSQTYVSPTTLWDARSEVRKCCEYWIASFSRIPDAKFDQDYYMDSAFTIYKILKTDKKELNDLRIEREEEMTWLKISGAIILDRWICHNPEDERFKQTLKKRYDEFVDGLSDETLSDMIIWAIKNKDHLKSNWLVEYRSRYLYPEDACDNFMAHIIYETLNIQKTRGSENPKAIELALMATFETYDGTDTWMAFVGENMDFRAIDILLRWGERDWSVNLIKRQFEPSDTRQLFNNLWIIKTLMKYGLNDIAEELTLIGDARTPSILLDTAVKSYSSLSYRRQEELRLLVNQIQRFVF